MADPAEDYGDSADLTVPQWDAIAQTLGEQPDIVVQPANASEDQLRQALDDVRTQSLMTPQASLLPSGPSVVDYLEGGVKLAVELYEQPFEFDAAEDKVGGFLEFAYLSGGWPGIDQATASLTKALATQRPANADALSSFIGEKTYSISLLISGYLRQLETEALKLLGQVFDERLAAIDAARKAFLDGDTLRRDEDGTLPARTKALIEGLKRVKGDRADLAEIVNDNATDQAIDLIAHRMAESLLPSGIMSILSPGEARADAGALYLLGPLGALLGKTLDELDEDLRDRKKLLVTASALTTLRTKQFLESEPTAVVLVTPASVEVPVDEAAIGARFSARLTELENQIKALKAQLKDGKLSALDATVLQPFAVQGDSGEHSAILALINSPTIRTGAEFIGLGAKGSRPEASLARLLLARFRDGAYLPNFTVWSLAPVVKQADQNLRDLDTDDTSPLTAAIYASLQQESLKGVLTQAAGDLAFTGFMLLATALGGPAAPLLLATELMLDVGDALTATIKYQAEAAVFDADLNVVGDAATLRQMLDRAPDLGGIILAWVGVVAGAAGLAADMLKAGSKASRQVVALQKVVPALSKLSVTLAASGLFVSLVLAAGSLSQPAAGESG